MMCEKCNDTYFIHEAIVGIYLSVFFFLPLTTTNATWLPARSTPLYLTMLGPSRRLCP